MQRVWFITGASSGFGRALAEAVLKRGDSAVVCARRKAALDSLALPYTKSGLAIELDVADARAVAARCTTAGAIFIGKWSSEAAGDYVAGGNHVLPTGGAARYASPLGVHDFRNHGNAGERAHEEHGSDLPGAEHRAQPTTMSGVDRRPRCGITPT